MQALVLSSLSTQHQLYNAIKDSITQQLSAAGYKIKFINLQESNIQYCNGCGYCGEKEIGVCVKKDDMTEVYDGLANSQTYIFIFPISFGGFNAEFKKALDRISPIGLAFYAIHKGEMHHEMRYPNAKKFLSIGILKEDVTTHEETFKLVSERLEKAFFVNKAKTLVFKNDTDEGIAENSLKEVFIEMELIS